MIKLLVVLEVEVLLKLVRASSAVREVLPRPSLQLRKLPYWVAALLRTETFLRAQERPEVSESEVK